MKGEKAMANKPVFGVAICPKCHKNLPIYWNGNFKYRCIYCYTDFKVKRQKLSNVESPNHKSSKEESKCQG